MKACCAWSTLQSEIFFNLVAVTILQVWWVNKHFATKVSFFPQYSDCVFERPFVGLFVESSFWKDVWLCSPMGQEREQKRGYDTLKNLLRREVCVEDATGVNSVMSGDYMSGCGRTGLKVGWLLLKYCHVIFVRN